jgi:hypothetical protein
MMLKVSVGLSTVLAALSLTACSDVRFGDKVAIGNPTAFTAKAHVNTAPLNRAGGAGWVANLFS